MVGSGNEIEFGDNAFVQNQGLVRVDPSFQCVCVLLNHYTFVIINITSKGLGEHFVAYKSQLEMAGEIKDFQFLHNSILPSFAVLCVRSASIA